MIIGWCSFSKQCRATMVALEPEAAAIFCQEKSLSDFYSESGTRSVDGILSEPNTNYMVIDIGGVYAVIYLLFFFTPFKGM